MLFPSLLQPIALERAASVEDKTHSVSFFNSKRGWVEVQEMTEEEKNVLVFGWPADGAGVWVLRFASDRQLPRVWEKRLRDEYGGQIQIMREYGATLVEDVAQMKELRDIF
ncbi:hypothetical protein BDV09DRAFT_199679 [Aspergillus tetrazonus]